MESEWIVSAAGFASRDSMVSVTRIKSILLGCELALSVGAYDHPIPLSHDTRMCILLGINSLHASLLPVAVNDSTCWKRHFQRG